MKTKEILFDLIKSMSQTEKRYFKIYASKYTKEGKSNYVRLFNVIDKLKFYDEKKVHQILSNEKFIKRLALEKHLLYKLILKSLRNYHSDISIAAKINGLMLEVEILFYKGLYEQCIQLLEKAEQIATDHEKKIQILAIYAWRRKLWNVTEQEEKIKDLNIQERKTIDQISNVFQYFQLYDPIVQLLNKKGMNLRDKLDLAKFNSIMKHPFLCQKNSAMSNTALQMYHNMHAFYSYANEQFEQAYYHFQRHTELIESLPSFIKYYEGAYISSKYNTMISLIGFNKIKALKEIKNFRVISKIKFNSSNANIEYRMFSRFSELELILYLQNGMFAEAKDTIKEVEKDIVKYQTLMEPSRKLVFYYLLASLSFGIGNYKNSLKWINNIINTDKEKNNREDLLIYARILRLIVHFEMGNDDLLPYLTKSTYRYLLKRGELNALVKLFLDFIKAESKNIFSRNDLIKTYVLLKKKMLKCFKKNTILEKELIYFDFITWLDSKIENRPFAEMVREEALQKSNR